MLLVLYLNQFDAAGEIVSLRSKLSLIDFASLSSNANVTAQMKTPVSNLQLGNLIINVLNKNRILPYR